jgi:PKD repeat protein
MVKKISLNEMKGLNIDQIIDLYTRGYRLEGNQFSQNKHTEKINEKYINIKESESLNSIRSAVDRIVDPLVNFGKATVSTANYDHSAVTINLASGNGSRLPNPSTDGAFNIVWWNSTDYSDPSDDPNREIVRCTNRSNDTLTIIRAQEGTYATDKNLIGKTYTVVLPLTAKTITDLQTDSQSRVNSHGLLTSVTHGVLGNIVGTSDVQILTNKSIIDPTNSVMAKYLQTSTGNIDISSSDTPSIGQVLTATSPTTAKWQSLAAPSCFFVSILGSPSSGTFPLAVYFNATIIGGIGPYVYAWSFGDGNISTSPAPFHTYTYNGTFTTSLSVTDSVGNSATSAIIITVLTGVGIVASGLGITESMSIRDLLAGFFNDAPSITETYALSDSLSGIYNASAGMNSPFSEGISQIEGLAMLSSISLPSTASVAKNYTITLTPTCYLYGTPISCPLLSWSSNNSSIATVSSAGVVTGVATGNANITTIAGITSNTCVVTVTP